MHPPFRPLAVATFALTLSAMAGGVASAGPVCSSADPACMDHIDDPQPLINDAAPGMVNEGAGAPAGALPKPAMKVLRAKPPAAALPAAPAMEPPPVPAETDERQDPRAQ